ncbi:MAG: M28 family peptidase [Clostridia bacterium]|nr:M28 family peptidase [Clostridia bacterium]
MKQREIKKMIETLSFVRTSGSEEEERLVRYFEKELNALPVKTRIVPFSVPGYRTRAASLSVEGEEIPCRPIWGFGTGLAEGELYYLRRADSCVKRACRERIVLIDGPLRASLYDFLAEAGALAVIASCGDASAEGSAIDQRARAFTLKGKKKLPCAMIHVKDTVRLVHRAACRVSLRVEYDSFIATSHNLIAELPGESEERIDICAHYDSTFLSRGSYDNLSGALALLYLAEHFASRPHYRSLRLIFCGSEEVGLCGSLQYCASDELKGAVLNINLDMLGSLMGAVEAISCADERMEKYLSSFLKHRRIPASVRLGIRSSDSTSFTYFGVPAVSFARYAPEHIVRIHTPRDLPEQVGPAQLLQDMRLVAAFTEKAAAVDFPVPFVLCDKVKKESQDHMKRCRMPPFADE